MGYLLDTHTFIWWIEDNVNLSYQSKQIMPLIPGRLLLKNL
jgi:PIN domain nuclease of toxin-antitoxin system